MRKGENIFKRKDGRWEARYVKGYEPSGRIKYGFCYGKTYSEAKEKAGKYKAAAMYGTVIDGQSTRRRLSSYCDEWLRLKKLKIRESTYIKYNTILENHIKPKLGGCFPLGIDRNMLDCFIDDLMQKDGLSAKTVRDIVTVLRSVLKYISSQFPGFCRETEIGCPKENRREMRVLNLEEQTKFKNYLLTDTDRCKFGVLLMLFSGIRIGEVCSLKWGNIDENLRTIHISSTIQRLHDLSSDGEKRTKIVIGTPKSSSSVRTVPMTDSLSELCRRFAVDNADAYILTGTEKYMEPRTLQYRIKKYTEECGLQGVHAHTLRHTFATRAVEVGFEIKSLSEILGHAATSITLERYVHSSMELKRRNMDKLSAAGL